MEKETQQEQLTYIAVANVIILMAEKPRGTGTQRARIMDIGERKAFTAETLET